MLAFNTAGPMPGKRVVVFICLLIVLSIAILYACVVYKPKPDIIGILNIEGAILTSEQVDQYSRAISEAMMNESVKGLVVKVDSPGGYADLVEQVYLDLLQLKARKPLVTTVVNALSGGYYISVASDYIYAHPTSMVGNVGVIGVGPPILVPSEETLETGAHKVTGYSRLLFPFNLTVALNSFAEAVQDSRGDRMKLSAKELRRGSIYMGREALDVGLVDAIGSLENALGRVAQETGSVRYVVVDLLQAVESGNFSVKSKDVVPTTWDSNTMKILNRIHPPPAMYYLYMPTNGSFWTSASEGGLTAGDVSEGGEGGLVLIDESHGNLAPSWTFDTLVRELIPRNVTVSFVASWETLEEKLRAASALIVAAPSVSYSEEQVAKVKAFVKDGRMLVLLYDPSSEYVGIPALTDPMNSLAMSFNVAYANGYLYNEEEHFGFYRNIYITDFINSTLTQNLTRIVLFTSACSYSSGGGVAWTSNSTLSSFAERPDKYAVISFVRQNGSVIAFGDITFMQEPYCYVEDNYKLVKNLASLIADVASNENAESDVSREALNQP